MFKARQWPAHDLGHSLLPFRFAVTVRVAMLNLTGGGLSGGYRKYLQRVVPLLRGHSAVADLLVAVPPAYTTMDGLGPAPWSWQSGEQWRGYPALRQRVRDWRPDVVLIPTARFMDCGAPCVSMVRNMEPMLPPTLQDGTLAWARSRLGSHVARRACARAARVIAVSEFVREYLTDEWRVNRNRVGVVYHGVDASERHPLQHPEVAALGDAPFLFAAGSLLRYRGLEDAISALALADNRTLRLAIAGDGSRQYKSRMQALASTRGVSHRITWLGHLGEAAMSWAYANCAAFVMTSRVEACPNTVLEAMASGAHCISTNSAPMPEFFRDAALYYEAGDAAGLATQITALHEMNDAQGASLRHRALQRSAQFSWDRTADGTVAQLLAAVAA